MMTLLVLCRTLFCWSIGHGTITSPNINSQFHQHFFAVRLDTEIDGNKNTVSTVDILPDDSNKDVKRFFTWRFL